MGAGVRWDAARPPARTRRAASGCSLCERTRCPADSAPPRSPDRGRRPSPEPGGPPASGLSAQELPLDDEGLGAVGVQGERQRGQVVGPGMPPSGEPVLREEGLGARIVGGQGGGAGEEPFGLGRIAARRPQPRQAEDDSAAARMGRGRGWSSRSASAHWPWSRASAPTARLGSGPRGRPLLPQPRPPRPRASRAAPTTAIQRPRSRLLDLQRPARPGRPSGSARSRSASGSRSRGRSGRRPGRSAPACRRRWRSPRRS